MSTLMIQYSFRLPEDKTETFNLKLNAQSLELQMGAPDRPPGWINLGFHQCPHCPLDVKTHPYCPISLNLVNIVGRFNHIISYDEIHMEVTTQERFISQKTTAQRGISSLIGIVFATSGCPHTAFFRPMARFHLPLSSEEETIYRATSMYLLAQYFRNNMGQQTDYKLEGLKKIYKNTELVNLGIIKRLRAYSETDSSINAIVVLDTFAKTMPCVIGDSLVDICYLFKPFLADYDESSGLPVG